MPASLSAPGSITDQRGHQKTGSQAEPRSEEGDGNVPLGNFGHDLKGGEQFKQVKYEDLEQDADQSPQDEIPQGQGVKLRRSEHDRKAEDFSSQIVSRCLGRH